MPRIKKRRAGGLQDDLNTKRPTWVGPGTVIAMDGANLWVSMLAELWKVAREQCRPATSDGWQGVEAVLAKCQELIEQFKRQPSRAGYKDITGEKRERPPEKMR